MIPKHYVVSKTIETIEIDGIENETSWKKANYTDDFIDIEGIKVPKQKTNVKMLWDNNFLYVFAKLYETHIWGDITERDKVIYHNNDFEVFINPNNNVFNYGEIEINALGTEWDLFLNKPYRLKGKADSSWNIKGLKSSVYIDGTINNPKDVDNYWTVEMAIPLKEILSLKQNNNSYNDGSDQMKALLIFETKLDTVSRNKAGIQPIQHLLEAIDGINNIYDLQTVYATITGISAPFAGIGANPDLNDSSMNTAWVFPGGLGLQRDYYICLLYTSPSPRDRG